MNKIETLISTMTDLLSEYNRRLKLSVSNDDPSLTDAREWSAPTATQEQMETGTSTDRLAMTPLRIAQAIAAQGLKVGSVAGTAKAGDWIPAVADIPALPASKITSGTFDAARIPTLNQNTTGSAATLATARTLTIGGAGKTFNGSANVSWTLAEMGAVSQTAFDTALGDIESVLLAINGEAP